MKGRPKKYQNPEEAKKIQKEKIRLWRLKNKDRIKFKVKEYQKKNPDIVKKSHKKYQDKKKDINKIKVKKRRKENPTKQKATPVYVNCEFCKKKFFRKVYQQRFCSDHCRNKAKRIRRKNYYKEYEKNYNKNRDPKKKRVFTSVQRKKWNQKYYSTQKGQITHLWDTLRKRIKSYTFSKVQTSRKDMDKLTGCSKFFLLKFIESKFYDHPVTNKKMTWSNARDWHIDHITPLKALNPKNEEHFKIANHFSNLQPMWADENLRKGANVTPGYGVAHLKRKYKSHQSLGDLTKISNEKEAKAIIIQASKFL